MSNSSMPSKENEDSSMQFALKYLTCLDNGDLVWKIRRGSKKAGSIAGWICKEGYRKIQINGDAFYCHRIVWLLNNGKFPEGFINHIDGNKLNNHISNLRDVTKTENNRNKEIHRARSGVFGVIKHHNTFEIRINNKYISVYNCEYQALMAAFMCSIGEYDKSKHNRKSIEKINNITVEKIDE